MKKYLLTFLLAIIIGFFLSNIFLNQYNDKSKILVSSSGEELYFIQYGVYSSEASMEENTLDLQSYIYNIIDDKYYVFVGITRNKDNADKISKYYKENNHDTIIKQYFVNNNTFLNNLYNYDKVLSNTKDSIVISSITNQVLINYEEVVING